MRKLLPIIVALLLLGCANVEKAEIKKFEDLGKPGVRISIGDPKHVPAGRYAMKVLENLKKKDPDLAERMLNNIVSKDVNVRAVLDKVVSGEVDAGFVYRTDALIEKDKVRIISIPKDINVVPEYPIAVLKGSDDVERAKAFVDFVLSEKGQSILAEYGFIPAVENPKPFEAKELGGSIVVYAAASLTDAFKDIAKEFEKETGCKVKLFFASSGSLRQRIEEGAIGGESGADVFASASLKHMNILQKEGFVESYEIFARNELVVIAR